MKFFLYLLFQLLLIIWKRKMKEKNSQVYKEGGINSDYSGVYRSLQPFKNIIRRYKYFSFGAY